MRKDSDDKHNSSVFTQMGKTTIPVLDTGVFGYLPRDGFSSVAKHESAIEESIEAFESECVQALSLSPVDGEHTARYEMLRPFVIKTLMFVGLSPTDKIFVLLARLIETLAVRPDSDLSALIARAAAEAGIEQSSVVRNIDKVFDIRYEFTHYKLTYLTKT